MSERKKQIFLEALKKAKKESVMGKLANGDTDPMEPWSKKHAPLDEVNTQVLWKYIKAMGRDPRTISLNDRLNLARTDKFKKFARDHVKLIQQQKEEVEQIDEMDKSQPSPGRDDKISHSTYGSRDKKGSDYFKGKEIPAKQISVKQMQKDALAILKKQGVAEETVNEAGTGTLMSYIKAKGLNPLSMNGNQKNKYSHSSEYKLFKHRRMKAETSGMGERGDDWNEEKKPVKEAVDEKDTVTLDIPLMIRIVEYAREDAKTDMDLHRIVENLINLRHEGVLTMDHYEQIVSIKKVKEQVEQIDELKKQPDNQDADAHITREDLRKWFSKTDPEGGWKRINSKGEAIGPCAREPGEPKPKCMSNEKRAKLSKKERAAAVAAKRKHDPVADRPGKGGKPVNVSNFGKGKLGEAATWAQQAAIAIAMKKAGKKPKNEEVVDEACWDTHKQVGMKKKGNKIVPDCVPKNEEVEQIDEKNKPTNPKLWARAKSLARSKFDVYPSAYANGWASKWYKSKGGGWRATNEETVEEAKKFGYAAINARYKKMTGSSLEDKEKYYKELSAKLKKQHDDYVASMNKKDEVKNEEVVKEGIYGIEDSPLSATNSVKAMESKMAKEKSKSARMIKAIYKKKGLKKETIYDWEKSEKGGEKGPNAKIILKGGKTMTGKDRDTIEIDPVVRTKLNGANGTKPNL